MSTVVDEYQVDYEHFKETNNFIGLSARILNAINE